MINKILVVRGSSPCRPTTFFAYIFSNLNVAIFELF